MVHYSMPGVDASVQGTFDLLTKALNLNGLLTTTGQVREAESRWKSLLLLVGRPFLAIRRNRRTTYLAFHIKGTSRKPAFSVLHSYRQVAQDFGLCEVKQSCAKRIHAALTSAR
jgi:hypothetical protein